MSENRINNIARIILFLTTACVVMFAHGQELLQMPNSNNVREGETVEYCHQHTIMNNLRKSDPLLYQQLMQEHATLQTHTEKYVPEKADVVYTIPVVFHVLHNHGFENVSDEQIFDALKILNRDYRKQNEDASFVHPAFTNLPADIEVEFKMATVAPDGTCFNGITRTKSTLTDAPNGFNSGQQQFNAVMENNNVYKGVWPHDNYLNIIIAKTIGGAAGYTFLPNNSGGTFRNSIFILHSYLGSIGTGNISRSRALTHEVGHWLNLSHTWGDNNDPGDPSSCSIDDGIDDTPNTIGVTSCKLNENTCGPLANVENYMDYSYCSKMFTPGQKNRMRAALNSSVGGRNKIWKESNLIEVGAIQRELCNADFDVSQTMFCAGETVQFEDRSVSTATQWYWEFEGGIPSTSTEQNPTVVYPYPGRYKVTLTATHNQVTHTKTKSEYINVFEGYTNLPYHEGFEFFPTIENASMKLFTESIGDPIHFEVSNTAAYSGKRSAKLNNFDQSGKNVKSLTSAPIDLSEESIYDITFSYRYAHRNKTSNNKEYIRTYFAKGCNAPWIVRTLDYMATLSNSPIVATAWTPASPSEWVTVHIPFNSVAYNPFLVSDFRFKLEFTADGGNNFYIDDINLYRGEETDIVQTNPQDEIDYLEYLKTLSIADNASSMQQVSLYPNPSANDVHLNFTLQHDQKVNISISDLAGKTINTSTIYARQGENNVLLDASELTNGMYLVKINATYSNKTLTFVKN